MIKEGPGGYDKLMSLYVKKRFEQAKRRWQTLAYTHPDRHPSGPKLESVRSITASIHEVEKYLVTCGRGDFDEDLPPDIAPTRDDAFLFPAKYSAPKLTLRQQWVAGKHASKDRLRAADVKDGGRAWDAGYTKKYNQYVKNVEEHNANRDEYMANYPSDSDFEDAPHLKHKVRVKPKGEADFIEPTLSLEEQTTTLNDLRATGKLAIDTKTKPWSRSKSGAAHCVVWSTNAFCLVEAKTVSCWNAAIVALTATPLAVLGIDVTPAGGPGATFAEINKCLANSTGLGRHFTLGPPAGVKNWQGIHDVFKAAYGSFIIFCYHYHEEDIEVPFSECPEGIPHHIVWNATTGLLQLYPETIVLTPEDRTDPVRIDKLLAQPPNLLRLHRRDEWATASKETSCIRQMYVEPHPSASCLPFANVRYMQSMIRGHPTQNTLAAMEM